MREPVILGENKYILAVNKPAGLITHSDGRTIEPSLAEWLIARCPYLEDIGEPWVSPQGERVRVGGLAHRLDRMTSGVLLAAKTNDAFVYLRDQFKKRSIQKTYLALVHGYMREESGEIVAEIARSRERPKRWFAKSRDASHPRAAITRWRVVQRARFAGAPTTLVEACPLTGRTHQIRVHFASIGHSLVADHLYAPPDAPTLGFSRSLLHASRIVLALPDGTQAIYEAPLPDDIAAVQ